MSSDLKLIAGGKVDRPLACGKCAGCMDGLFCTEGIIPRDGETFSNTLPDLTPGQWRWRARAAMRQMRNLFRGGGHE